MQDLFDLLGCDRAVLAKRLEGSRQELSEVFPGEFTIFVGVVAIEDDVNASFDGLT